MDQGSSQARQLNESLFELWRPEGKVQMQVLFFHGFQPTDAIDAYDHAHERTWFDLDGSCIWPATWLVQKYPQAHILSVSYNACLKCSWDIGGLDMYLIAENLITDLVNAGIGQIRGCPVILVGHCFGGLVIKELCVHASREISGGFTKNLRCLEFLHNVRGIFFYSTPHHGTHFADVVDHHCVSGNTIWEFVKVLSTPAARLHYQFQNLRGRFETWCIEGVGEGLPTKWGGYNGVIVPEAAARYGSSFHMVTGADHFSICKPKDIMSRSFDALTNLLDKTAFFSRMTEPGMNDEEDLMFAGFAGKFDEMFEADSPWLRNKKKMLALDNDATDFKIRPENLQHLPKSTVGLDQLLTTAKIRLELAKTLGLVGMGGVGKTTLAMKLFNDLGRRFKYTCFIKDVKEIQGSSRADVVKEAFLKHLHHYGKPVTGKEGGLASLGRAKVLLILDDVASEKDLEIVDALIGGFNVHEDSRFVVTSRNDELLKSKMDEVYRVPFLTTKDAKDLFLSYAFRSERNPSGNKYVDSIVKKCGKLPLSLEVIGKYLNNKPEIIWMQAEEMLDKAKTVADLDHNLWAKLQVSYNALNRVEQYLFLDAATVFYNHDLAYAKTLWKVTTDETQDMAWQRLVDLSLVWEHKDAEGTTRIDMHEQLRSLGRKLALTPEEGSLRFWDEKGETMAWKLLSADNREVDIAKDIVALRLGVASTRKPCDGHSYKELSAVMNKCFRRSTLCKMTKLRYLVLGHVDLDETCGEALPSTLVELLWSSRNLTDLPFDPSLQRDLCILYLEFENLRTLPTTFGQLSSLRRLEIKCENLKRLPDSIENLAMLERLKLSSCLALEELPRTVGQLVALKEMFLLSCTALSKLPNSLGTLALLKKMHISGCDSLAQLPDTLKGLVSLEEFWLQRCKALTFLPNSFGQLSMLKKVAIIGCSSIKKLPGTLGGLVNLEDMCLQSCYALSDLSYSFGCMPKLKKLEIIYCYLLNELPLAKILGRLVALEYLILRRGKIRSTFPRNLRSPSVLLKLQNRTAPTPGRARGIPAELVQKYGRSHGQSLDFHDKARVRCKEDWVQKKLSDRWMVGVCIEKDELQKRVEMENLEAEGELFYEAQENFMWEEGVEEVVTVAIKRVGTRWKKVGKEALEEKEQLFYEAAGVELSLSDVEEEEEDENFCQKLGVSSLYTQEKKSSIPEPHRRKSAAVCIDIPKKLKFPWRS